MTNPHKKLIVSHVAHNAGLTDKEALKALKDAGHHSKQGDSIINEKQAEIIIAAGEEHSVEKEDGELHTGKPGKHDKH